MASQIKGADTVGISPHALAIKQFCTTASSEPSADFSIGDLSVEVRVSGDSVWALIRRKGRGGLALRAAYLTGTFECASTKNKAGDAATLTIRSASGVHVVTFRTGSDALDQLRMTVRFTPAAPMLIPFIPRDLYPLDAKDDPLGTKIIVEARQRGLNSGLLYFRIEEPAFGNVFYFQNFTSLNTYYRATKTTPKDTVGGAWPELGYLMPTPEQNGAEPGEQLPAGVELTLSDAILIFRSEAPPHERESARQFLQMLGTAYKMLDLPHVEYRDWVDRAERTLRDLNKAPAATIEHYGHRYIHPYTAAEYPDVMVQMSIITAIHDWGKWSGTPHPLEADFKAGLAKFYDPKLKALRRYLPNVGADKEADAVDSWYLYHPMLNLGILALDGDEDARTLLMKSIDFGIEAAHHFDYKWPVQYNITDFSVITNTAKADGRGQTDVGGIYAWLMLQMFELTDDKRFLDEARCAIDAAIGLRFNINYQANLTAWGAAACMRLWRITNQKIYLEQSYVYLASFFHNCELWESDIELARHYSNFLGVTCLQDAPYMAIYECFDSFVAFERYLNDSGPDLEPAARMLISEFCKYALHRGWFYYPDALPPEALSPTQRETNGHIDRKLSFPVEDLYGDGQPAGQVGQEVYGAGAALIFATRTFHHVEGAPFRLYCDHLLRAIERAGEHTITVTLDGGETCIAAVSLIRLSRRELGKIKVSTAVGDVLRAHHSTDDRIAYNVPAGGRLILTWE